MKNFVSKFFQFFWNYDSVPYGRTNEQCYSYIHDYDLVPYGRTSERTNEKTMILIYTWLWFWFHTDERTNAQTNEQCYSNIHDYDFVPYGRTIARTNEWTMLRIEPGALAKNRVKLSSVTERLSITFKLWKIVRK